mmetsp:Transcript_41450/g.81766  ORF Transcript_41450/g.81766 Transcript_41450/m.81766 type:complete len:259 (+) Transcript_41450:253-1029(+)
MRMRRRETAKENGWSGISTKSFPGGRALWLTPTRKSNKRSLFCQRCLPKNQKRRRPTWCCRWGTTTTHGALQTRWLTSRPHTQSTAASVGKPAQERLLFRMPSKNRARPPTTLTGTRPFTERTCLRLLQQRQKRRRNQKRRRERHLARKQRKRKRGGSKKRKQRRRGATGEKSGPLPPLRPPPANSPNPSQSQVREAVRVRQVGVRTAAVVAVTVTAAAAAVVAASHRMKKKFQRELTKRESTKRMMKGAVRRRNGRL